MHSSQLFHLGYFLCASVNHLVAFACYFLSTTIYFDHFDYHIAACCFSWIVWVGFDVKFNFDSTLLFVSFHNFYWALTHFYLFYCLVTNLYIILSLLLFGHQPVLPCFALLQLRFRLTCFTNNFSLLRRTSLKTRSRRSNFKLV